MAASVTQRLHSRQLKVCSSTRPSVPGTVRARRSARPQLGHAAWSTGLVAGGLHRCCAHHPDTPSAAAAAHRRRGAIALPCVGYGADCRSLLFVSVSFRSALPPDHLRNKVMLVAQKLHHFGGGGDAVVPVARRHSPIGSASPIRLGRPRAVPQRTKRSPLPCPNPSLCVSNVRLKFKHMFEKKARPHYGKYVTFWALRFSGYTAGPEKPLSPLRSLPIAAALQGGEPQGG